MTRTLFLDFTVAVTDLSELLEGLVALFGNFATFLGRSVFQNLNGFVDETPVEFILLKVVTCCSAVTKESENNKNCCSKANKVDNFASVKGCSWCSEHMVKA